MNISFGTSGHRGIIGDSFTLQHVNAIAYAIADILKVGDTVIIGYDTREGNHPDDSPSFTASLAYCLKEKGIHPIVCNQPTPTPVISWAIRHFKYQGGIILTASHNPPQYNGLKFNPSNGAPAPKDTTNQIETLGNTYISKVLSPKQSDLELTNLDQGFAKAIKTTLQKTFPNTTLSKPISIDTKHGACAPTWNAISKNLGVRMHFVNETPLPDFGGIEPNPTYTQGLVELQNTITETQSSCGIANDPDGDRHIVIDENGTPLTPEETTTIIADYFLNSGAKVDGIATTVASSQLIKSVCETHTLNFYETAVGFKYFAPFIEASEKENTLCFAVESSGGFSMSGHTLEKCGFLPGLLLAYISESQNKPISELKEDCLTKYGKFSFVEDAFTYDAASKPTLQDTFKAPSESALNTHFKGIKNVDLTDGVKVVLENNQWVLMRLSGTEPIARIYAESDSEETSRLLIQHAKDFLNAHV
jgi:phosphoglucomutase